MRATVADLVKDMGLTWSEWKGMAVTERVARTLAHQQGREYDPAETERIAAQRLPNGLPMPSWLTTAQA